MASDPPLHSILALSAQKSRGDGSYTDIPLRCHRAPRLTVLCQMEEEPGMPCLSVASVCIGTYRGPSLQLYKLPTVGGFFFPLLSYLGGLNTLFRGKRLLQYGYRKVRFFPYAVTGSANIHDTSSQHRGRPFKIPLLSGWVVVVSNPAVMEDIRTRPQDQLWLTQALMNVSIRTRSVSSFMPTDRASRRSHPTM